jgi:hypothetical protein
LYGLVPWFQKATANAIRLRPPTTESNPMKGNTAESWLLLATSSTIVLAPFATTTLSYRTALVVQASLIAGALLAVVCAGWAVGKRISVPTLESLPPRYLGWLVLWLAAAALGTLVGLMRGNQTQGVLAQAFSLGVMPFAAGIALPYEGPRGRQAVALGILSGCAIGGGIQIIAWLLGAYRGEPSLRLYLPNGISIVGVVPIALAFLFWAHRWSPKLPAAAYRTTGSIVAIIAVLSGLRSLWLLMIVAGGIVVVVTLARPGTATAWGKKTVLVVLASAFLLGAVGVLWRNIPGPNLVAGCLGTASEGHDAYAQWTAGEIHRVVSVCHDQPVAGPGLYRLKARAVVQGNGTFRFALRWQGPSAEHLRWSVVDTTVTEGDSRVGANLKAPEGAVAVSLQAVALSETISSWRIEELSLRRIGGRLAVAASRQTGYLTRRVRSIDGAVANLVGIDATRGDRSSLARYHEARAVIQEMRSSSRLELAFGHGLGAVLSLSEGYGRDPVTGAPTITRDTNYLHNFYLFLIFKLGVIGSIAVLGSVALLGLHLAFLVGASSGELKSFAGVMLVVWLMYLTWAAVAPEIIDFRIAPLLGLCSGVVCRTASEHCEG